jgi:Txe/YoeB family toxin of Txe-Axe toxin-antitoxin module
VFLNETCKDALSLTEFINQIQVSFNELEDTGHLGYAEGISKVFLKNLKGIDYNRRPIHCSDIKRETIYIKDDENKWEKDDEQKSALTKAIKNVANKNIKKITEWQKMHPDYNDSYSKQNDKYMKIVLNSMSGSTKAESEKNYEKIVKNVVKEVVINKSTALI